MLTFLIFALLIAFIIFTFIKLRPKKAREFPVSWDAILESRVNFYSKLTDQEKLKFQNMMMQFLSGVYIDAVGFKIVDIDRILIAASAVIPVFRFNEWNYTNLSGITLYPDNFNEEFQFEGNHENRRIAGVVGTGRLEKQMILSKKALYLGFDNKTDKHNTAIHEFVHLIDKLDGNTDGLPERIMEHSYSIPWLKMIHDEMERINNDQSDIRSYGGTNQQEFFAVASEYFFERPKLMRRKHPELYNMLATTFNVEN